MNKFIAGFAIFVFAFTFVSPHADALLRFNADNFTEYSEPTDPTPRFQSRSFTRTYNKPTCAISASPSSISIGESTTITWVTTNSYYVADAGGKNDTSGSIVIVPNTLPYTHSITAVGPDGSTSCSVTITELEVGNYKTEPTIAQLPVPTNTLYDGTNVNLYRFSVTAAETGELSIGKITFGAAVNGVLLDDIRLYAYTDSNFSNPVSGYINGQLADNLSVNSSEISAYISSPILIPKGQTIYFILEGDVSNVDLGNAITLFIKGDYTLTELETFSSIDSSNHNSFIWSPNTNGISTKTDKDWTNGYNVSGLDSMPVTLQK